VAVIGRRGAGGGSNKLQLQATWGGGGAHARREPHRGPGHYHRGALSQPHFIMCRYRNVGNVGRGVPSPFD